MSEAGSIRLSVSRSKAVSAASLIFRLKGANWSDRRRLSGPPPLRSPWLAVRLGQLLATLQRDQEVERFDLVSLFAADVELFEPAQQLGGRRAIATDRRLTEA